VSPVKYELGFCIPEYGILHSHSRVNLKSYTEDRFLSCCSYFAGSSYSPWHSAVRYQNQEVWVEDSELFIIIHRLECERKFQSSLLRI
jgi:hypothetical protein